MNLSKENELFAKANIETIAIHKRSETESWGYIKFKNGQSSGDERVDGISQLDVFNKMAEILSKLD